MLPGIARRRGGSTGGCSDVSADAGVADPKTARRLGRASTRSRARCRASIGWCPATGAGTRLARLIEQSGVRTTPSAIVLISIVCAAGLRR